MLLKLALSIVQNNRFFKLQSVEVWWTSQNEIRGYANNSLKNTTHLVQVMYLDFKIFLILIFGSNMMHYSDILDSGMIRQTLP